MSQLFAALLPAGLLLAVCPTPEALLARSDPSPGLAAILGVTLLLGRHDSRRGAALGERQVCSRAGGQR